MHNVTMEIQSDSECFQDVIVASNELPLGIDDELRNQLLDELDSLEYQAGLQLLAGPDIYE